MMRASDLPPPDAARTRHTTVPRHVVLLRFTLINAIGFTLAAAVWVEGWLDAAFSGYTLWLTLVIIAVFGYGLALCACHVLTTSTALAAVANADDAPGRAFDAWRDAGGPLARDSAERALAAQTLRLQLSNDIAIVQHIANALVFLGLVGTVIGFIVALSGVEPDFAASAENVAPMVATLIEGMSIALYTTLIGAVLHLWLTVDYRLLASATLQLYSAIVNAPAPRVS